MASPSSAENARSVHPDLSAIFFEPLPQSREPDVTCSTQMTMTDIFNPVLEIYRSTTRDRFRVALIESEQELRVSKRHTVEMAIQRDARGCPVSLVHAGTGQVVLTFAGHAKTGVARGATIAHVVPPWHGDRIDMICAHELPFETQSAVFICVK
jgi:hypothetical protein